MCLYKKGKVGYSFRGEIGFDEFWAFLKQTFVMNRSNILYLKYMCTFVLLQCCFKEEKKWRNKYSVVSRSANYLCWFRLDFSFLVSFLSSYRLSLSNMLVYIYCSYHNIFKIKNPGYQSFRTFALCHIIDCNVYNI